MPKLAFDHIHIVSADPEAASSWYRRMLDAEEVSRRDVLGAPQIRMWLAGITLLIRAQRQGEAPIHGCPMTDFEGYSSHKTWGMDHFGLSVEGDIYTYFETLRAKGVAFLVEPYEFAPGFPICFIEAPDGVSIEILPGG
ncbi:MAG: VOC family protein [Pseudomonadota bacterium]